MSEMNEKKLPQWVFEMEHICHDRGRRMLLAQAENARLRETLRRVVEHSRRRHATDVDGYNTGWKAGVQYCAAGPWHPASETPPRDADYLTLWRNEPDDGDWQCAIVACIHGHWNQKAASMSVSITAPRLVSWAGIREPG